MKILGYITLFALFIVLSYYGGKEQMKLIAANPNYAIVPSPMGSIFLPIK